MYLSQEGSTPKSFSHTVIYLLKMGFWWLLFLAAIILDVPSAWSLASISYMWALLKIVFQIRISTASHLQSVIEMPLTESIKVNIKF